MKSSSRKLNLPKTKLRSPDDLMLMLTHTWILRDFIGGEFIRRKELSDLYVYNILPDVLPLHESISSGYTHKAARKGDHPDEFKKARFIDFHLLVDDYAHFGEGESRPGEFDPDSKGYAYVTGRELLEPLRDIYARSGIEISLSESAYMCHVLVEMAFDLSLYEGEEGLLEAMTGAMGFTLEKRLGDFARTAGWYYDLEAAVIEDTLKKAAFLADPDRIRSSMTVGGRTGLFLKKFRNELNQGSRLELESLFRRAMELTKNKEAFLGDIRGMLQRSGFNAVL